MNAPARKLLSCSIALSAVLAMPMAFAQDQTAPTPQEPPPSTSGDASQMQSPMGETTTPVFAEFDVDSDGKISKTEAAIDAKLTSDFATRDKNRDGSLSEAEYNAGHAKHEDRKRK
ncbi:EF-hand domain-containing protein [Lysobacter silvisoli]|uniref:EF-hand domain-containing protein n=1 Tax=Lysobacter silvisoli TaxID=2293254 RepID=A0A371K6B2_9GAMM|nr:EF-hand domain-containing protein [Lysobacter silvisoli]RDZ29392.1 EF-hand domain-containing protein [Lysobacter silvisoli]